MIAQNKSVTILKDGKGLVKLLVLFCFQNEHLLDQTSSLGFFFLFFRGHTIGLVLELKTPIFKIIILVQGFA